MARNASLSGVPAEQTGDFWALARAITDELAVTRSLPALVAVSGVIEATVPVDADGADAWMLAVSSLDAMVTNLGVIEPPVTETVRLVDITGPAMSIRMAGEQIIGVATFAGSLRMVNVAHDPVPGLLDRLAGILLENSGPADEPVSHPTRTRSTADVAHKDDRSRRLTVGQHRI